ncbi:hypothetical protein [Oceanobacillus saliphilus]|uniref:hypothetical protein n=1 Tax=Oceanobacillus saliphilus TaxID=2925834 RepID=UPI00201D9D57|nr:hypothetical protein [Oceanobacillus saliphilus]
MIQIVGETTLHFNSKIISVELIQRLLDERFEMYFIDSHIITGTNHHLDIKFVLNTIEYSHYKRFTDNHNYALNAFRDQFPSLVKTEPFIVLKFRKSYKSFKNKKDHFVMLINNK